MPFLFSHVCDLLERLEQLEKKKGLKATGIEEKATRDVYDWFHFFRDELILDKSTWLPLFSILLPELRCDRIYGFKEHGLVNCVASSLCLGKRRKEELEGFRLKADGDLGRMVETVMAQAENMIPQDRHVSVQQVEVVLNGLAGLSSFSSEELTLAQRKRKSIAGSSGSVSGGAPTSQHGGDSWLNSRKGILSPIYTCLTSRDAKWFTRVILKCLLPVKINRDVAMRALHFALPDIFSFRSDLKMSLELLGRPSFRIFPDHPADKDMPELRAAVGRLLVPEVGIKVGRPLFIKGISFEHVFRIVGKRRVAMDRKYDGEYCQIHIDLEAGSNWLRIFSKSGRDSTHDRFAAHDIIRRSLNIDQPSRRAFNRKCILEAEFLVYCEGEQRILEFHHIKNHVPRAGRMINATPGGPPVSQHVLLKFFDCILLDDVCQPCHSYDARRNHLGRLVTQITNHAELGEHKIVDFSLGKPAKALFIKEFARATSMRWEGYVVKPCDGPYMQWGGTNVWIKLKKDYIPGLGDTADMSIVGGAFEANRGRERKLSSGIPTTFHVGFLTNRKDVASVSAKPAFKVLFTVSYCLTRPDLEHLCVHRNFWSEDYKGKGGNRDSDFEIGSIANGLIEPDFLFHKPIVFEVMGAGFDKVNTSHDWVLRWPRVLKIYTDRGYLDAVDFQEFQLMAAEATAQPADHRREEERWLRKFTGATSPAPSPPPSAKRKKINIQKQKSASFHHPAPLSQESPSSINILSSFKKRPASFSEAYTAAPKRPRRNTTRGAENTPPITPSASYVEKSSLPPLTTTYSSPSLRSSPLRSRSVYLAKYLASNNPRVSTLLSQYGISTLGTTDDVLRSLTFSSSPTGPAYDGLPSSWDSTPAGRPGGGAEAAIVLVEERKRSEVQSLITSMIASGVKNVEMYSWRILTRIDAAAKSSAGHAEDWSLFHVTSF